MQKKNFITLVLSVIGGLLFGIGMCMCLIAEWNAFNAGVVIAAVGVIALVLMLILRLRAEGKTLKINIKTVGTVIYGAFSALVLGVGMCMVMIWNMLILGIVLGIVGSAFALPHSDDKGCKMMNKFAIAAIVAAACAVLAIIISAIRTRRALYDCIEDCEDE